MAGKKIKTKAIRKLDDIKQLRLGDKVEIKYYGPAIYYGKTLQSHIFLGIQKETSAIYQLEVQNGNLNLMQDGSLRIGEILSETIFHYDPRNFSTYDLKEMILTARDI